MTDTAYKANTRQTREFIIDLINPSVNLVPFIQSSPGMGKSAIVNSIGREYGLQVLDHRLSTSAPEDLSGLPRFTDTPHGPVAEFAPFNMFPTEGTPLPKGKEGWILFLDEFNSAPKSVQAAAYKLVLDRAVGQRPLHERVFIVAAGNLATDRAIVNPLSTAMQSRLVHIEMTLDAKIWREDVGYKQNYDSRVMAYLEYMPAKLMDFRPDHNQKTFCCPRTWEFVSKYMKGKEFALTDEKYELQSKAALLTGMITSGTALEFITFTKLFHNIPKIKQIVADPEGCMIPQDEASRFATIMHLMDTVDETNFSKVITYLNRYTSTLRVVFFRGINIQKKHLRSHPDYRNGVAEVMRYLND